MNRYCLFNSWNNSIESTDYTTLSDATTAANSLLTAQINGANNSGSISVWDRQVCQQVYIISLNVQVASS